MTPPPGAFLQASPEGEAAIAGVVEAAVGAAFPLADLFCGIGTFALRLAAGGAIHAIDGDAGLVAALARTHRVTTTVRDLFRNPLAGGELARFAAVVCRRRRPLPGSEGNRAPRRRWARQGSGETSDPTPGSRSAA